MTIALIVFFVCLLLSAPIGVCLGLAAMVWIATLSPDLLVLLPQKFLEGINSFPLLAIPLFIFAGSIMGRGGIARRIVDMAMVFVGRVRGGLGMVSVLSTMFFSGVCGSASADTAAVGSITLPEMKKRGYPPEYSTALLAAAGGTSTLVPPSIDLIIIGVIANLSIGGLFAAGLLPAAVNAVALMALAFYFGRKFKIPLAEKMTIKEKANAVGGGVLAVMMVVIILGGILGGIFTPTEASAVAVVYGLVVSFFVYREITLRDMPVILLQTVKLSGLVLFVIGMASVFSFVLTYEQIPQMIAAFITAKAANWIIFVIFVTVLFLFIGMIMDALPALIILLPILIPAGVALGMDPLHLAILIEANVAISLITPPVGICLYVACGISKVPLEKVIRPLLPFLAVLFATLILISYVPDITLFIPRLLGYAS